MIKSEVSEEENKRQAEASNKHRAYRDLLAPRPHNIMNNVLTTTRKMKRKRGFSQFLRVKIRHQFNFKS